MAERRIPRGLLDPESEAIAEAYEAGPAVRRQLRGLLDVVQRAFSLEPQEQTAGDTALDIAGGFVPGVSQAMALRDIERARRAGDPAGMAMAATEFVPLGRLAGMMRGPGPIMSELDVYHGTPHRFPATEANPLGEFDASKIGTGEGAQAYGHGIYFAEKPEIARYYKDTIQADPEEFVDGQKFDELNPEHLAAYYAANHMKVRKGRFDPEEAANFIADRTDEPHQKAAELLRKGKFGKYTEIEPGSLYKADLPDEMIDRMLDWDKPLSEQPAAVRNAFNDLLDETGNYQSSGIGGMGNLSGSDAADLYNDLKGMWNENYGPDDLVNIDAPSASAAVSEFLRRRGIPGIKYLDAGSRGQGGSGTRNFVVFPGEEKKVKILERK